MNFVKGLVLAGSIFLSSCTYNHKNDYFPKELATYLKNCSCGSEHAASYIKRTNETVDISGEIGHDFVNIDQKIINSLVLEDTVIFGHTHSVKVDDYLLEAELQEDEALGVKKSPGLKMEKRMFSQFPSPKFEVNPGSEFETLLSLESIWFIHNPDAYLRHVIVLLSDYEEPRVIEYGLTERIKEKYRKAVLKYEKVCPGINPLKSDAASLKKCEKAIRNKVELEHLVSNTYDNLWSHYYDIAFNPSRIGDYEETSLDDFIELVNRSGVVFIHDLGYLDNKTEK